LVISCAIEVHHEHPGPISTNCTAVFLAIPDASAGNQAPFKGLFTVEIDGEHKPLLLFGTAHSRVEDGHITAVLNPDASLVERLQGGCGYSAAILKEIIAKRCDAAVSLWIDAYKNNRVLVGARYRNRISTPAKFNVREFPK
jgi:hypothetical protein